MLKRGTFHRLLSALLSLLLLTAGEVGAKPNHAGPGHAKPSRAKPSRTNRASATASATHPRSKAPRHKHSSAIFPGNVEDTPGYRYAQLTREACYLEITARKLPVEKEDSTVGVDAPTRLLGPLHDVTFRPNFAAAKDGPSPYSIFDCRLLLALDDLAVLLKALGIVELRYSSAYRPAPPSAPSGQPGRRHAGALAIDVHQLKTSEGKLLDVEKDFHGRIGSPVCGKQHRPPVPSTPEARLLRKFICSAADARLFQSILTPNNDRAHRNHFHLEVTQNVRWFIIN